MDAKGLHVLYELFSAFHGVAWILTDCGKIDLMEIMDNHVNPFPLHLYHTTFVWQGQQQHLWKNNGSCIIGELSC